MCYVTNQTRCLLGRPWLKALDLYSRFGELQDKASRKSSANAATPSPTNEVSKFNGASAKHFVKSDFLRTEALISGIVHRPVFTRCSRKGRSRPYDAQKTTHAQSIHPVPFTPCRSTSSLPLSSTTAHRRDQLHSLPCTPSHAVHRPAHRLQSDYDYALQRSSSTPSSQLHYFTPAARLQRNSL